MSLAYAGLSRFRPLALSLLIMGNGMGLGCSVHNNGGSALATCDEDFGAAPVVPLGSEPPPRIMVDSPLPEQLALGRVIVRYRAEHVRILPVYGPAALDVSPRVGHLHISVDDASWHWLDASGEPIVLNGFAPGPHKLLVELADSTHKIVDRQSITFEVPPQPARAQ